MTVHPFVLPRFAGFIPHIVDPRAALALLTCGAIGLQGCDAVEDMIDPPAPMMDMGADPAPLADPVTYAGIVRGPAGALADAEVSIAGRTARTDADGRFALDVEDGARHVVNVELHGHVPVSYVHHGGGLDDLEIELKAAEVFAFDAAVALDAVDSAGTRIELPGGSLVDAEGRPAAGPVEFHMYTYRVADEPMVGDMSAITADGRDVGLVSFGALHGVFTDAAGNDYQIADGSTAAMTMNLPEGVDHTGDMPLWWYDEDAGRWIEEGQARIEDGVSRAELPHFTVWNVDQPVDDPTCLWLDYAGDQPIRVRVRARTNPGLRVETKVMTSGRNTVGGLPANTDVEIFYPANAASPTWTANTGPRREDNTCAQVALPEPCDTVHWNDLSGFTGRLAANTPLTVPVGGVDVTFERTGGDAVRFTPGQTANGQFTAGSRTLGWTGEMPYIDVLTPVDGTATWSLGGTAANRFGADRRWLIGIGGTSGGGRGPLTIVSDQTLTPFGTFDAFGSGRYPTFQAPDTVIGNAANDADGYAFYLLPADATAVTLTFNDASPGQDDQHGTIIGSVCVPGG